MAPDQDRTAGRPPSGGTPPAPALFGPDKERPALLLSGLAIVAASTGLLFATSAVDRAAGDREAAGGGVAATLSTFGGWRAAQATRFASAMPGNGPGALGVDESSILVPLVVPKGHPPLLLEVRGGQLVRIVQLPAGHPSFGQPGLAGEPEDEGEDDDAEECPYAGSGQGHHGTSPHGDADGEADDDDGDPTADATLPDDPIHRHLRSHALPPGHPPIGSGGSGGSGGQEGRAGRFDRPDWI